MRHLATVRRISKINPINGADRIEVAVVDGWEVVVAKKDNFKEGDQVVYVEIDSIVPDKPEFEFLRDRKFRVRTIKLRGQVSQGLILPMSILPKHKFNDGVDVTDILGIKKYDPESEEENKISGSNKKKMNPIVKFFMKWSWFRFFYHKFKPKKISGAWPAWIQKTDEERIQNLPKMFEIERDLGTEFTGTEKVDGQSATYFLRHIKGKKYDFGVCSRNLRLPHPEANNYWRIAYEKGIEHILYDIIGDNEWVVLQGEIYGSGIQKNKYKLNGLDFKAFNLKYPDRNVPTEEFTEILKKHGIDSVDIIYKNYKLPSTIHELVETSKGKSVLYNRNREGIVWRNYEKNISFKVINPDFLLEDGN